MKKIITLACALSCIIGASAQSIYDAVKLAEKDLNGTARFVGMGGAMGALGGDITTMGTNPAGIGIYRSNDVMTSFSFSAYGAESKYDSETFNNDKNRWSFDNIGFVFSTKVGNETPLRYVNFGFNYKRSKSLYKNMSMAGFMGVYGDRPVSQANYMAQQATDAAKYVWDAYREHLDYSKKGIYSDNEAGWLGAIGFQGGMIERDGADIDLYHPLNYGEPYSTFNSREQGGVGEYDFNIAFNISDRVYLGVTVGAYDVNYKKFSGYDESYDNKEGYLLDSYSKIKGSGFDVKLGAIIRPFENSPFRVGFAVHTPVFYKLTYATSARMTTDYITSKGDWDRIIVDTYDYVGDMERDYRLNTPWLFNVNMGYTVGSSLALGMEYEYEDYSTMKFKYPGNEGGGDMEFETAEAKNCLKGTHTFRLGAEYKVIPQFAFRLGYNYTSSAFNDEAVKYLPSNSIMTDTDFSNKMSQNVFTLGIGYRGSMFYAGLAYKFSAYKEDFYPFFNEFQDTKSGEWALVTPQATKVTNTRSQVLMTLGLRF